MRLPDIPDPPPDVVFLDLQRLLDAEIADFSRRRRFYPLGAHPATFRERYMVDALRRINAEREHPDPETEEAISYHVARIAEFEAGELEAKAQRLRAWVSDLKRSAPEAP